MLLSTLTPILLITICLAIILHKIKQPLVISYIVAGIIVGPQVLNLFHSPEQLEMFSQAGIIFLLFIVGIHLNPQVLKEVGRISLITGIGQVIFTTIIGFFLTRFLGFDPLSSIFIAIALTFSSTIIIMKLIADKKELNKLYAKISIGFLLVQDLAATIILILMPMLSPTNTSQNITLEFARLTMNTTLIIAGILLVSKYILPKILDLVANSIELLFLTAITWGLMVVGVFAYVGLSIEVGALIAGIALATSPYAEEIASRLRPLRDFFLVTFFILLGSHLNLTQVSQVLFPSLVLSLFVLVGNPLIVYTLLHKLGYTRKVSFKSGLAVAQISEFSLILMSSAVLLYPLSDVAMPLVTVVGIITIAASTYMILYSDQLFSHLDPYLARLPISAPEHIKIRKNRKKHTIYWFGYNPLKEHIAKIFSDKKLKIIVIDYDPTHTDAIQSLGLEHIFGDASDVEFLSTLDWEGADTIISMIPDQAVNKLIIKHALSADNPPKIIVTSQLYHQASNLLESGANHVVLPFHITATHIQKLIAKAIA